MRLLTKALPLALAGACALTASASAETRTTILGLPNESSLSAQGDQALVDVRDPATKRWSLQLEQDGRLSALPIPSSSAPIDADLGTDSSERPTVVFSVCSDPSKPDDPSAGTAPATVGNCDLQILRIGVDSQPQPIANANSAGSERTPTLWRGKLAFSRIYATHTTPIVYTKDLIAPRKQPSTRQPGVPTERCSVRLGNHGSCLTRDRYLDDLELYGSHLAETVGYYVDNQVAEGTAEVRLVDVDKRSSEQVALLTSGESGQSYVDPSFDAGRLSWYKACYGDPSGCQQSNSGAYRYHYASHTYEHADDPYRALSGYAALPGGASLQVDAADELGDDDARACDDPTTPAVEATCPLVRTGPLDWTDLAASHVK